MNNSPFGLTRRELEVAHLAAEGVTCREIASELSVSVNTIKTHLERAYRKLGVRNRIGLERKLRSTDTATAVPPESKSARAKRSR